jgi:hypothetical protein
VPGRGSDSNPDRRTRKRCNLNLNDLKCIQSIHHRVTEIAKIRASLAEGAEGKILFSCPEEFLGQEKRLFLRIGLSPILKKKNPLSGLCVSNESWYSRTSGR